MPSIAFEWLARLYTAIESGADWPKPVLLAKAAFLPKEEGEAPAPLKHRVLTIASAVYRRWASMRLQDLQPWVE
eukprot:12546481-Alexandrium_andersonii.AAC.1